ncbi:MAG: glutamate-1-semialdehyde 2,1-aminomutase [Oscillospiraceae bacterium]|nr:glutamate-1-semialdehyde 2,1-aminomutase [Oscillospiraceae bacterium]
MEVKKSAALFDRGKKVIPGGVNSPVRAFLNVGGEPRFIESAEGCRLKDVDGNTYIDYVCSWGPAILGHLAPVAINAVKNAADNGLSFGAPCEYEVEIAELICKMCNHVEMVRMVNSGTEAAMSAVRAARGFTGRDYIVKFEGCYHGHADSMLVAAGSGALTHGVPDSAGVPAGVAKYTLTLPYNDIKAVEKTFSVMGEKIAAVIVEPVAANMGVVLPVDGFLEGLRQLTGKHEALLIFDEVITGFRLGPDGATGHFGIKPDLSVFGKIIGGGMPVGAYGGRRDVMSCISPLGAVYQAGTLSGNPLAMAAGLAVLRELERNGEKIYGHIGAMTDRLATGLSKAAKEAGVSLQTPWLTGLMGIFFTDVRISSYADIKHSDKELYTRFFHGMLDKGIYFAPSPFEAAFLSYSHSEEDIDYTISAAKKVFVSLCQLPV